MNTRASCLFEGIANNGNNLLHSPTYGMILVSVTGWLLFIYIVVLVAFFFISIRTYGDRIHPFLCPWGRTSHAEFNPMRFFKHIIVVDPSIHEQGRGSLLEFNEARLRQYSRSRMGHSWLLIKQSQRDLGFLVRENRYQIDFYDIHIRVKDYCSGTLYDSECNPTVPANDRRLTGIGEFQRRDNRLAHKKLFRNKVRGKPSSLTYLHSESSCNSSALSCISRSFYGRSLFLDFPKRFIHRQQLLLHRLVLAADSEQLKRHDFLLFRSDMGINTSRDKSTKSEYAESYLDPKVRPWAGDFIFSLGNACWLASLFKLWFRGGRICYGLGFVGELVIAASGGIYWGILLDRMN